MIFESLTDILTHLGYPSYAQAFSIGKLGFLVVVERVESCSENASLETSKSFFSRNLSTPANLLRLTYGAASDAASGLYSRRCFGHGGAWDSSESKVNGGYDEYVYKFKI